MYNFSPPRLGVSPPLCTQRVGARLGAPVLARRLERGMGLLAGTLRRVERIELVMNRWADTCMRFMPRDWVEAQGFVWADAVLAAVLLGLVTLSYVMLAHMLRSWGVGSQNSTASAPKSMRAAAPAASGSGAEAARDGGSFSSGGRDATSCAEYGPVHEEIDGMTALMRASSQGDEACAVELIQKGASVDARDSQEGFTALLMASAMGESLAAPVFLLPAESLGGARGGAFAPVHGSSPVPAPPPCLPISSFSHATHRRPSSHLVSSPGHLGVVHRLLAANADVNAKNNDGATALMLATYAQKESVVRSLIGSGARQGLSAALAFAEQADAPSLVGVLRKASPSASPSLGWLPWSSLWSGWAAAAAGTDGASAPFDLGFLPLAVGLMIVGFMLLLFQLDVDSDGGAVGGHGGPHSGDALLAHQDLQPPRCVCMHANRACLGTRVSLSRNFPDASRALVAVQCCGVAFASA